MFRTTEALATRASLAIEPIVGGFATSRGPDGRQYAQYGVGQPLLAIPFYWAGRAMAAAAPGADWRHIYGLAPDAPDEALLFAPTAVNLATRFAVSFFNIVLSALFAVVAFHLFRTLTDDEDAAFFGALLYAFGSLAWAHSRPFFSESGAAFFIALAWLFAMRARTGRRPFALMALAGASAGFAALVRMDSVLLYPGLALVLLDPALARVGASSPPPYARDPDLNPNPSAGLAPSTLRDLINHSRFPWLIWVAFASPAAAFGGALLLLNVIRYGGPLATGYTDQPEGVAFATPVSAGLYGFLFSAGKGLFFFSPALALSFYGWRPLFDRGRWVAAGIAASVVVPLVILSKWQNWAGGWCWGPRHIFMIHVFLAAPAAAWLAEFGVCGARRCVALAALAVGAAVNLLGCSQDFITFHQIFYRDPTTHYHVLYDNFDEQYWGRRYGLFALDSPGAQPERVRLAAAPAPIQHSLYIPQSSVWNGYPIMLTRMRRLDNLWVRLLGGAS